jgi:hypothetical protein
MHPCMSMVDADAPSESCHAVCNDAMRLFASWQTLVFPPVARVPLHRYC